MPMNRGKVLEILLEEVDAAEERCAGYHQQLRETVAEIITAERGHIIQRTNIQQKVDDQCEVAGRWLAGQS